MRRTPKAFRMPPPSNSSALLRRPGRFTSCPGSGRRWAAAPFEPRLADVCHPSPVPAGFGQQQAASAKKRLRMCVCVCVCVCVCQAATHGGGCVC